MNKKERNILISIFILIFIIIVLILLLNSVNNKNNYKNNILNNNQEANIVFNNESVVIDSEYGERDYVETKIEYNNKLEYVKDRYNYFTISSLFNHYINLIGFDSKEELSEILSPQYINQYNINEENILDKIDIIKPDNYSQTYKITIFEMITTKIDFTTQIYIVRGKCRIIGKENSTFDIQAMFEVDIQNKIYYVYPEEYLKDNGISNLKVGDTLNYIKEEIVNNERNQFEYTSSKQDNDMAKEYFNDYKELINYYPEEAYNKLDKEYAQKRFSGSVEKFKEYIKENKEVLDLMTIEQYKIVSNEQEIYYVCADQYDKVYMFKLKDGLMSYTAYLDNYTVMTSSDIEKYNKYDEFDKSKYNLTKCINMVNTKDYALLHNVLNETFRANNFENIESFKKYIQTNMYELNSIEIENFDDSTYEYNIFKCKLINLKNKNESKNMTFIIDQGENFGFSISFSFE